MARLYTNENFPLPVAEELRRLGHDVLTLQDTGRGGQAVPDELVLAFASTEHRVLITLNRKDFKRLHLTHPDHAGIVLCTYDPDFLGQASRIDAVLKQQSPLAGQVLRVNRPGP
jgi:predicted nuclease of predicted toxin-antitoxin system